MPVDLAMFLSHTGANVFDYSPFVDDRFSYTHDYEEDNFIRSLSFSKKHIIIPNVKKNSSYFLKNKAFVQKEEKWKEPNICYSIAENGKKKKVSFADDKGLNLVEIREIPGSPISPINQQISILSGSKHVAIPQKCWKVAFDHPPYTDCKLMELLETNNVALESVKIEKKAISVPGKQNKVKVNQNQLKKFKEENLNNLKDVLEGTIKVKNIAYEKHVFIRISFDRWLSSTDVKASYLKPKISQKHQNYDTFVFSVEIPPSSLKYEVIEFCVGYYCNDGKYWDNNGGVNYRLITEIVDRSPVSLTRMDGGSKILDNSITLNLGANLETFCDIDSWNSFMLNKPYW